MEMRFFNQLLFILIVSSSRASRDYIVSERGGDEAAETELIDEMMLSSVDVQSFIEKLSKLHGKWPSDDEAECDAMNTLDLEYNSKVRRRNGGDVRKLLNRVPTCGQSPSSSDDKVPHETQRTLRNMQTKRRRTKRQLENAGDLRRPYIDTDWLRGNAEEASERKQKMGAAEIDRGQKEGGNSMASRVVGGHIIPFGSWSWLAAVGRKGSGPRCGGTLIAEDWVVTAAHCFNDEEKPCQYNVRLGSRSWLYDEANTHVDVTVQAIYRHPNYDGNTHENDIALLKLSKAVELNESSAINAICLPPHSQSVEIGTVCMAAGWGRTAENIKTSVNEAREVEIPVISYSKSCGGYPDGVLRKGMVCAGYENGGRDTCQGDSGGPLAYKRNGRWIQLGLTSFGEGCARKNFPGIYTDVGHHLRWLASVTERF